MRPTSFQKSFVSFSLCNKVKAKSSNKVLWLAIYLDVCDHFVGLALKGLIYADRSGYSSQEETFANKVTLVIKLS